MMLTADFGHDILCVYIFKIKMAVNGIHTLSPHRSRSYNACALWTTEGSTSWMKDGEMLSSHWESFL